MTHYLYLGDSYTIGTGVSSDQRWPVLLQQRLQEDSMTDTTMARMARPTLFARNGWTTTDLLLALHHATPIQQYDHVFLMIGVNDQYQGLPETGVWLRFTRLLKAAISFSKQGALGVSVVSIPDWSRSPFGRRFSHSPHSPDANSEGTGQRSKGPQSQEIDVYNEQERLLTEKAGATWIDVTELSRNSSERSGDFADDGLHPSAKQYQRWVDNAILPSLKNPPKAARVAPPCRKQHIASQPC